VVLKVLSKQPNMSLISKFATLSSGSRSSNKLQTPFQYMVMFVEAKSLINFKDNKPL